ncbi:MAG: histidinol-phosphate transaminase [Verrucomicrobia bacterium]|nr:histidinol-phosphate transaminase [Verrucomicrobiota bacterium]
MSAGKVSKSGKSPAKLIRPMVHALHPYVPGEQPRIRGLVKLNTNENPYPPSPKVIAATKAAVDGRLRLYPNPTAQALREKLAKLHKCAPENIIIGNGSDELLIMAVRAFTEPVATGAPVDKTTVQYFTPSYSLYPVLSDIHGSRTNGVPLKADFGIPTVAELKKGKQWQFGAALTFVTTPNAPSGRGYSVAELELLCQAQKGIIVLDEAYVDFAMEHALNLALKYPHVIVSRTFSKAYSLCFQRVGYFIAHPEVVSALDKIRDSYNVNGLGQVAGLATLGDLPYYRANFKKIIATRTRLTEELTRLGFSVLPSQTNFILAKPPQYPAEQWLGKLRDRKVLVRWFKYPEVRDYLRITIGSDAEADVLLKAVKAILS